MAPIDFYYAPISAPCRSVLLTAKAIGVELNLKMIDLTKGDQLTPDYIKLNPQHKIPTINDNGFVLCESRAILAYLVNQYGKDYSLYPKDPKKRAVVDQRLYFDMGSLNQSFGEYLYPQIFAKAPADPTKLEKIKESLNYLDGFIGANDYVTGNTLTIADLSIVATVSTMEAAKIDLSGYKNVTRWFIKVKFTAPDYVEISEKGLDQFKAFLANLK